MNLKKGKYMIFCERKSKEKGTENCVYKNTEIMF